MAYCDSGVLVQSELFSPALVTSTKKQCNFSIGFWKIARNKVCGWHTFKRRITFCSRFVHHFLIINLIDRFMIDIFMIKNDKSRVDMWRLSDWTKPLTVKNLSNYSTFGNRSKPEHHVTHVTLTTTVFTSSVLTSQCSKGVLCTLWHHCSSQPSFQ